MATRIGWDLVTEPLVIKAGSSGALEMACVVMQSDGSPLPSYDSWTCRIVFVSPFTGRDALVLVPTVAGDAMTHTLTATLTFTPEDTSELPAGTYAGDAKFTAPSPSTDAYFSAEIPLSIESSTS